ncbi:response regulator [Azospirillum sp.]|uniref:response regulator n=1 Tax=Azospirillum sp. TaxID=34012 RepID=UPI003D74E541
MRVLLVEDDPLLGSGVRAGLEQAGVTADWTQDGEEAEAALSAMTYDAVVLDLGLPRMDGLSLLRRLRSRHDPVPVLVLTARGAVSDRVTGLDAGADDYLAKPFDLAELQARLRALLRRSRGIATPVIRCGRIELDPAARAATLDGKPVDLLPREFATLEALLLNTGRVLSKAQIEDRLYGWGDEIESNAIEVYVHHLRRKLYPDLIRTVRGVGYFVPKDPT